MRERDSKQHIGKKKEKMRGGELKVSFPRTKKDSCGRTKITRMVTWEHAPPGVTKDDIATSKIKRS